MVEPGDIRPIDCCGATMSRLPFELRVESPVRYEGNSLCNLPLLR